MAYDITYNGQNNGTGDARAKNLKLFTGEVLSAFSKKNVALQTVKTRTISGGVTAQFIVTGSLGDADVSLHTPGADISTTILKSNERTITIGGRYVASQAVDSLEEKLSQYEIRGEIAKQQAEVLSTKIDKEIFTGIYATRLVTPVNGQTASVVVTNTAIASATTDEAKGNAIIGSIFAAQSALDTNNVPQEGRVFVSNPSNTYAIVQSSKGVNRDFNGMDNGSIATGKVMQIAGVDIIQTNHLPTFEADGTTANALVGMLYTPDVFGVVKADDISAEANYDFKTLSTVLTSYYAIGMGALNPSCLAVIKYA